MSYKYTLRGDFIHYFLRGEGREMHVICHSFPVLCAASESLA